jgi:hypothetical protein
MHKPSEETVAVVNELIPQAKQWGAYCMGLVCAVSWNNGAEPPRTVLEAAAECESLEQAQSIVKIVSVARGL